jgi:large subunit ribosomal protein L16
MEIIRYKKKHKKIFFLNILSKFLGSIHYGYFGVKTQNSNIITTKQMETVRKIFVKITKRTGKLFIRVYFFFPKTGKSLSSRMGKGVGSIKN